jgi:hypothetical protein
MAAQGVTVEGLCIFWGRVVGACSGVRVPTARKSRQQAGVVNVQQRRAQQ